MINFTNIQWGLELGHLGMITIDPLQRSSGIGYSMFMMMLRKGFSELKFNKIDLYCIEENKRGYDFYTKKCKLVNEGLLRSVYKADGEYKNWYVLSMLKSEWLERFEN